MTSPEPDMNRLQNLRNKGKNQEERRRRCHEITVLISKKKRAETSFNRRDVPNKYSNTDEYHREIPNIYQSLAELAANATKPEQQIAAVQNVCKILSTDIDPPINEFIECGILPILIDCLKPNNATMLQFEATGALAIIASGTSKQTNKVVAAGVVPLFLQFLCSPAPHVWEKALWALGNIIGDGPELRDFVIKHGIVQHLLSFIKPDIPISFLRNVTWVIVNLCRYKDPPPPATTIYEILLALNVLIHHTDTNILKDTVRAISYLTDAGNDQIQLVIESGVVPKLIRLLRHTDVKVETVALRALGNILTGSDEQTQVVLNYGALSYFPALLSHQEENIRKDALWFLSNVTAGNQSQVQAVINCRLLHMILVNLRKGEFQTQKEAARAIRNLTTRGDRDQVYKLNTLLTYQDTKIIDAVLDGINIKNTFNS